MQLSQLILRIIQLVFLIIITGLIGNVIASAFAGNPGYINYAIFVCVFGFLNVLYGLAAAFMDALAIPFVLGVFDLLTTLFTFIAGVVLAAKLGVHSCSNDVSRSHMRPYTHANRSQGYTFNNPATNGSDDPEARCRKLQAATAFFWFLFAAFVASTVISFMTGQSSVRRSGGIRKGGPAMSQV